MIFFRLKRLPQLYTFTLIEISFHVISTWMNDEPKGSIQGSSSVHKVQPRRNTRESHPEIQKSYVDNAALGIWIRLTILKVHRAPVERFSRNGKNYGKGVDFIWWQARTLLENSQGTHEHDWPWIYTYIYIYIYTPYTPIIQLMFMLDHFHDPFQHGNLRDLPLFIIQFRLGLSLVNHPAIGSTPMAMETSWNLQMGFSPTKTSQPFWGSPMTMEAAADPTNLDPAVLKFARFAVLWRAMWVPSDVWLRLVVCRSHDAVYHVYEIDDVTK